MKHQHIQMHVRVEMESKQKEGSCTCIHELKRNPNKDWMHTQVETESKHMQGRIHPCISKQGNQIGTGYVHRSKQNPNTSRGCNIKQESKRKLDACMVKKETKQKLDAYIFGSIYNRTES